MTGKRAVGGWGQGQNPEYTTSVTSGLCESGCEDRKGTEAGSRIRLRVECRISTPSGVGQQEISHSVPN